MYNANGEEKKLDFAPLKDKCNFPAKVAQIEKIANKLRKDIYLPITVRALFKITGQREAAAARAFVRSCKCALSGEPRSLRYIRGTQIYGCYSCTERFSADFRYIRSGSRILFSIYVTCKFIPRMYARYTHNVYEPHGTRKATG